MSFEFAKAHVLANLRRVTQKFASRRAPPLFVAIQGPQGSGKTFLANLLRQALSTEPHNLSVAVVSIDDLYLPHAELKDVAQRYPQNKLLQGRGLPGTHDIALGTQVLRRMKDINTEGTEPISVEIPSFDKSLHDGEGDRLPIGTIVNSPIDIVIFEGWFVGFTPSSTEDLERRYQQQIPDLEGLLDIQTYSLEEIKQINEKLENYVDWWNFFDTFIQIKPPEEHPYSYIYAWRLEQEHYMKERNGGKGMTDEQVKRFVDRYIPGYVFFSEGVEEGYRDPQNGKASQPTWAGNGLKIIIDKHRAVLKTESF